MIVTDICVSAVQVSEEQGLVLDRKSDGYWRLSAPMQKGSPVIGLGHLDRLLDLLQKAADIESAIGPSDG